MSAPATAPRSATTVAARPMHFEFMTNDPAKTGAFFAKAFGWQITKWNGEGGMEYHLVNTGEGPMGINGGIGRCPDGKSVTTNVLAVKNIDDAIAAVTSAGAQIVMPKFQIPTIGWLAYAVEPTGIMFGMIEPDMAAAAKRTNG